MYFCYRDGRKRVSKKDKSKWEYIFEATGSGLNEYLKALLMLVALVAPGGVMYYMVQDTVKSQKVDLWLEDGSVAQQIVRALKLELFHWGVVLAIGIAVSAFCISALIIYRTRKLEKDE